MKLKSKSLIVQANHVIEARYKLSLEEQRLMKLLISMIEPGDENDKIYSIRASDISDVFGISSDHVYHSLKQVTSKLLKQVLFIKRDGGELQVNWLSSAEYLKGGIVELEISQKLRPYLLQLKEHFTKYQLKQIAKLKSSFSIRVYELCKCYEYKGGFEVSVDDLKKMFGLENKYRLYGDLKRKVLLVAKQEINETTDIMVEFVEVKEGKRVDSIRFHISKNKDSSEIGISGQARLVKNESPSSVLSDLILCGVTKSSAESIVKEFTEEKIRAAIMYCESQSKEGKIRNPGGFIVEAIKNEYRDSQAEEKEKKQKAKKAVEEKERREKALKEKQLLDNKLLIQNYLDSLSKDQLSEIEKEFIELNKGNYIVMQRYSKEGLNNPIVKGCFLEFVLKKASCILEHKA